MIGLGSQQSAKESVVRPKKVPPPPPPRKSSRLPGSAVIAVNTATINGQLPKPSGKFTEPTISKHSVTFDTSAKGSTDIIRPPKQFAGIELETKVERKSSIGSLKQFTTPLLESKRDKKEGKDSVEPEIVGKRVSLSNLDSSEKEQKKIDKDLDLTESEQSLSVIETPRKIVDGKVTNLSDDKTDRHERTASIDSSSSGSSFDSQKDIWIKRKDEVSEASLDDTVKEIAQTEEDVAATLDASKTAEQSTASSSSKLGSVDTAAGVSKKPKPAPPERRSSLSSKSKTDEAAELEEKIQITGKPQQSGSIDRLV